MMTNASRAMETIVRPTENKVQEHISNSDINMLTMTFECSQEDQGPVYFFILVFFEPPYN